MSQRHMVVLGAGVIGLSSAIRLQEQGYAVTIVARDFPGPFETVDPAAQINYTSPWGGAHNRWVVPPPESVIVEQMPSGAEFRWVSPAAQQVLIWHNMARETFHRMGSLAQTNPEAGITFMRGVEYLEAPGPEYLGLTEERARELGLEGFRLLQRDEFPDEKVAWGCEYRTWCVNPMVYCCFLLRRFVLKGGKISKREVRDPAEIFTFTDLGSVDVVVNASGNGFGDDKMFITRGQTCLVSNPCDATVTRQNADGSWTFCVPRGFEGGTVIGGTKEPDNWSSEPSVEVRDELLRNFAATYPPILHPNGGFEVLRDIVGRRPTRLGGPRLDVENIDEHKTVVHAYGLGGRGYELSWGVAWEVMLMVKDSVASRPRAGS